MVLETWNSWKELTIKIFEGEQLCFIQVHYLFYKNFRPLRLLVLRDIIYCSALVLPLSEKN